MWMACCATGLLKVISSRNLGPAAGEARVGGGKSSITFCEINRGSTGTHHSVCVCSPALIASMQQIPPWRRSQLCEAANDDASPKARSSKTGTWRRIIIGKNTGNQSCSVQGGRCKHRLFPCFNGSTWQQFKVAQELSDAVNNARFDAMMGNAQRLHPAELGVYATVGVTPWPSSSSIVACPGTLVPLLLSYHRHLPPPLLGAQVVGVALLHMCRTGWEYSLQFEAGGRWDGYAPGLTPGWLFGRRVVSERQV